MWFTLDILIILAGSLLIYLHRPQFAKPQPVKSAQNAKLIDGIFHNSEDVPVMVNQQNTFKALYKFLFTKTPGSRPSQPLPSMKTNLFRLARSTDQIVWMGHSSYFVQLSGKRILIDPVFSSNASPVPHTNVAFPGSNIYQADDIPELDYLLITYDHWDHLDYPTIRALKDKIGHIVTPLGVGSYFRQWGFHDEQITEGDWFSCCKFDALEIHILPAQHFSGRMLKRNQTLWGSFALVSPHHRLYFGGDSGYSSHFKIIGEQLGAFDLVILEAGQYSPSWPYIHMMPEQTAQAACDLGAKALLTSHNSKFKLSRHRWEEPLERILACSREYDFQLCLPLIGQPLLVNQPSHDNRLWWRQNL